MAEEKNAPPLVMLGPWKGVEQFRSPKTIDHNQFQDAMNMVGRAGRATVRPGYALAQDSSFVFTPFMIVQQKDLVFSAFDTIQVWPAGGKVFYSINGTIRRCNYDGSSDELVWNPSGIVTGFALDIPNQDIYAIGSDATIRKYDSFASGGGNATIVSGEAQAIRIAYFSNKIYWTNGSGELRRADTSGLNVNKTTLLGTGGNKFDVAIDTTNSRIYFSTPGTQTVSWIPLAGGSVTNILTVGGAVNNKISIAIDSTNSQLYVTWSKFILVNKYNITRCGLDGSNPTSILAESYAAIGAIAVDGAAGRLFWLFTDASTPAVMSMFTEEARFDILDAITLKRSQSSVSSTELINDIILFHLIDKTAKKGQYAVWLPTKNRAWIMTLGYTPAIGDFPMMLVQPDRDATPSPGIDYLQSTRRSSFLWKGATFTDGRGGLLIAHGGASTFNIFAPFTFNAVWQVNLGDPTDGTFTLTYGGFTTSPISIGAPAAEVQAQLQALPSIGTGAGSMNVLVTGGLLGPYTVTAIGIFAGTNWGPLTGSGAGMTGGTFQIIHIREGGSVANGMAYLLNSGIVRPAKPTFGGYFDFGSLTGVFGYRITYYSTLLHQESPPSEESALIDAGGKAICIRWVKPSTLLFNASAPGSPFVDRVRVYRRRYSSNPALPPDGIDASDSWYLSAEVDIDAQRYYDNVVDVQLTDDRLPFMNEYPPDNAQYLALVGQKAVYASDTPNDRNVWVSETPKIGGVSDGELGFEYVRLNAYSTLAPYLPTDVPFTGLMEILGQLLISTDDHVILANVPNATEENLLVVRPLLEVKGFASHWCAVRTNGLPDSRRPLAVWVNSNGWAYSFDGVEPKLLSRGIDPISRQMIRLSWRRDDFSLPYLNSFYYATAALDTLNNRMIFGIAKQDPVNHYPILTLALDLDTGGSWYPWDIQARMLFQGREWNSADGTVCEERLLLCIGSKLYKMLDGRNDAGVDIPYFGRFGKLDFGVPTIEKKVTDIRLDFERRTFGGDPAQLVIDVTADGTTYSELAQAPFDDDYQIIFGRTVRGKRVDVKISGVHKDNQDHAELVGYSLAGKLVSKIGEAS